MTEEKKGSSWKESRKKALKKAVDTKDKRNHDDAIGVAELLVEELTGLGVAKRVAVRVRNIVAREFIDTIDEQSEKIKDLEKQNRHLTDSGDRLLKLIDDQDQKIAELEAALKIESNDSEDS